MSKYSILVFAFSFFACSGESQQTQKVEETVSISKTETVEFFLARAMPVEGGFSITEQAEHFSVSEIQHREEGVYYIYKPEEGFTGADLVKINRADSNGEKIYSETLTILNIKVTE